MQSVSLNSQIKKNQTSEEYGEKFRSDCSASPSSAKNFVFQPAKLEEKSVKKTYKVLNKHSKPFKFDFKEPNYNIIKPEKLKSEIDIIKSSIRKLPMFETFTD